MVWEPVDLKKVTSRRRPESPSTTSQGLKKPLGAVGKALLVFRKKITVPF